MHAWKYQLQYTIQKHILHHDTILVADQYLYSWFTSDVGEYQRRLLVGTEKVVRDRSILSTSGIIGPKGYLNEVEKRIKLNTAKERIRH